LLQVTFNLHKALRINSAKINLFTHQELNSMYW